MARITYRRNQWPRIVLIVVAPILLVCITLLILATPHARGTDPKISVGRWTAYMSDNSDLAANPQVRALAVNAHGRV